jgi:hypothetical protein
MNKSELLALCTSLGLSATEDMTIDQLKALVATYKPVANATATVVANATSGKAPIVGFHYYEKLCYATLSNGITGIIGDTKACSLGSMLKLKDSGVSVAYTPTGETYTDKKGVVKPKYKLEFSF